MPPRADGGGPPGVPAWLDRRWWATAGVSLPAAGSVVASGLCAAGAARLAAAGVPRGELLAEEGVRAVLLCVLPGAFAAGLAWWARDAPFARPLATLCGAAAAWFSLDAGVREYRVTVDGRGEGVRRPADVWPVPLMLGGLAAALRQEHRHGRGRVREEDEELDFPRIWRGEE